MKRKVFPKRDNYEATNESLGFDYSRQENGQEYWAEEVGYEFTLKEIEKIENASNSLHQMCFGAIDYIIQKNLFKKMNINSKLVPYIIKSWNRGDWFLNGRFDLCVKNNQIKLLEYNADTPTSLVEAALAQWNWKEERKLPDQFNSIYEKMVAWWEAYLKEFNPSVVHFTTIKENLEDFRTTELLMECAKKAGVNCQFLFVEDIGSDGEYLYDMDNQKIDVLYHLYPLEWFFTEAFGDTLLKDNCRLINPAWSMLLSNKAILAVLNELYPHSPYLLKTYFSPEKLDQNYVKKPFLSREGQNVTIVTKEKEESSKGLYESDFCVYQEYCELPKFVDENGEDKFAVVGSWIIGEESAGIGIREDSSKITKNTSRFVSNYITDSITARSVKTEESEKNSAKEWRPTASTKSTHPRFEDDEDSKPEQKPNILLGIVGSVVFLVLCGWFYSSNETSEQENAKIKAYNQQQQTLLNTEVFSEAKQRESKAWISANIDKNNQSTFESILKLTHDLVEQGLKSKSDFMQIDQALANLVFCIQGEKDINNFETFMDSQVFETENHKKMISYLKNQYNYDNEKVKVPSEDELLSICKFDSFEKDLDKLNKEANDKETDPKKKVVVEDGE